jgi:hypothetical protein
LSVCHVRASASASGFGFSTVQLETGVQIQTRSTNICIGRALRVEVTG